MDSAERRSLMRHYPSDSPEAMTRVVALALLANGAIDPGELEVLKGSSYCFRLRLDPSRFEQIVDEFYDDLPACGKRKPTGQYDLSDECVRSLLGDIKNPVLRQLAPWRCSTSSAAMAFLSAKKRL